MLFLIVIPIDKRPNTQENMIASKIDQSKAELIWAWCKKLEGETENQTYDVKAVIFEWGFDDLASLRI